MYGMTNYGKYFADELKTLLICVAGFRKSQFQMSIYYNYPPHGSKLVVLSYIYDCVYWCTYKELGKLFVDTLGNIFHVNLLLFTHWFMSIGISHIKDYSISVYQYRYATSDVSKYLDTGVIK